MKKVILIVLYSIFISNIYAFVPLSNKAQISLITCNPSKQIYTAFGHSAIRVEDRINNIDLIFHWGIFDYTTPNFISRFVLGTNLYEMGVYPSDIFIEEYDKRGTSVYAQALNLSEEQIANLWSTLWENYLPENRKYQYNFIFDNCATRPYHILINSYNHNVIQHYNTNSYTYRDIIHNFVDYGSLVGMGIDIVIGSKADKLIGTRESISFPIYTMQAMEQCYINRDSSEVPIVKATTKIVDAQNYNFVDNAKTYNINYYINLIIPLLIISLLTIYYFKYHNHFIPILTPILLILSGILGLLIMFLWIFSSHPLVNNNFNILWLNPLNIIIGIYLFLHHHRRTKTLLTIISLSSSLSFLIFFLKGIQASSLHILLWWATITIAEILTIMTYQNVWYQIFKKKRKTTTSH